MSKSSLTIAALGGFGAVVALAACGGPTTPPQQVALSAQIQGAKMAPDKLTAHQDDTITLTLTADRSEGIHLHGYDLKFAVKPGEPLTKTFKADKTGSFEIEIEDTSTHLGELDVYPR